MMGRNEIDLKKSGGDFLSVNTFPPKQTSFLSDLSVLYDNRHGVTSGTADH